MLLATRSEGKLWELRPLFADAGINVVDLTEAGVGESAEEAGVESYHTFEENAVAKARYFRARTGMACVAYDSGRVVTALEGQPGVLSKRWAGRGDLSGRALDAANNAKLLAELRDARERSARYVCVAALCDRETDLVCRGEASGRVLAAPRGDGGFGYDSLFLSDELGVTFGEATREMKEGVSHRGRAFRALIQRLPPAR